MADEFACRNEVGAWVPGFASRKDAIVSAIAGGKTPVLTAQVSDECPSYFARFEARSVLARMISGLEEGEKTGKLVGGHPARVFLQPILSAGPSDHFMDDVEPKEWHLQVDLMNRLQAATAAWISENHLDFVKPKFIGYGTEQLHIGGANIDIQIL